MKYSAILAAGEGSRLRELKTFKPIVKINGTPLIKLTLTNLQFDTFQNICIIFHEDQQQMDLASLQSVNKASLDIFFKTTKSSMHSLYEIMERIKLTKSEHLFVSMVDSIVKPKDAKNFIQFCHSIKPLESAIMVTSFVDDEKPLTVKANKLGLITEFQCPLEDGVLITSGVYYFSENVRDILKNLIEGGHFKMRNFLTELVKRKHPIHVFVVDKSLDIDRVEDIKNAELFLT